MAETKTQNKPEILAPEHYGDEDLEGQQIENPNLQTLMQLNEAEVSRQMIQSRAFPRSLTVFRRQMREMVTYDEATAQSCLYAFKRGGKQIEGPSINFAASAMQCWGNVRTGSRIVDIGDEFVTAQGFFWDMEKNMAVAFEVLRRITSVDERTGKNVRFSHDMIMVTGNAAGSIALRNAILKGIPKTAWGPSYKAAQMAAIGNAELFSTKRDGMLKAFSLMGASPEQVFGLLGVKGIDDVTYDNLIFLAGVHNSIKEGDAKVDEVFAIENMANPDQVKPPRPKESAFKRDATPAEAATKPREAAANPSETRQDDAPEIIRHDEQRGGGDDGKQVEQNDGALEADRRDFIKDAYAELAAVTKVRDIPALQDRITNAGVMSDAEEKTWAAACDAHGKNIMAAAKAGKK